MVKHLFLSLATIMLVACSTHDDHYYRVNPQALQQALKSCPSEHPPALTCDELNRIAIDVNQLVYSLQMSPQGFGTKIIALQGELAKQKSLLRTNPNQPDVEAAIDALKQQLAMRLAIVKWLESPEN
jgi:hypothetical protein